MLDDEVLTPELAEAPVAAEQAHPPELPASIGARRRTLLRDYLPIIALLLVVAWLCKVFYQPGHDWGDDFALYIHQAKALVNGNVGEVVATNRYAVDNSGWSSFSPVVYPWGFPILLAPVVAIWGVSYAKLKLVVIATFLGYLFCLYRLILRRAGALPAALIVALLGSSVSYIGWTGSVLSDYPFMCFAALTLVWIDRCRDRNLFEGNGIRDLVILGFLAAYSMNIRREGLALLAAMVAMHAVVVGPRLLKSARDYWNAPADEDAAAVAARARPDIRWSRIAVPYVSFLVTAAAFQVILPNVLIPHFDGTGTQQIKPNIIWFRDILAEQIGLKDIGASKIELLGSWRLAAIALGLFVALAVVGLVVRLLTAPKQDAPIVFYVLGVGYIVGTAPFHEGRYLLGITPWLAYFAFQAMPTLFKWAHLLVWPAVAFGVLGIAGLTIANITDMKPAVDYHRVYNGTINGPTSPAAIEMEDAVKRCTRGDDVIAFFRARAMSLLTDRKAIQTGDINQVMTRADWFVSNNGSSYSQPLVTDADAARLKLKKVWGNSEWTLFLIPGGRADGRRLPC